MDSGVIVFPPPPFPEENKRERRTHRHIYVQRERERERGGWGNSIDFLGTKTGKITERYVVKIILFCLHKTGT